MRQNRERRCCPTHFLDAMSCSICVAFDSNALTIAVARIKVRCSASLKNYRCCTDLHGQELADEGMGVRQKRGGRKGLEHHMPVFDAKNPPTTQTILSVCATT